MGAHPTQKKRLLTEQLVVLKMLHIFTVLVAITTQNQLVLGQIGPEIHSQLHRYLRCMELINRAHVALLRLYALIKYVY